MLALMVLAFIIYPVIASIDVPIDLLKCTDPYGDQLKKCYKWYNAALENIDMKMLDTNPEKLPEDDRRRVCCAFFTVLKPCQIEVLKDNEYCRQLMISHYKRFKKSGLLLAKSCIPRYC